MRDCVCVSHRVTGRGCLKHWWLSVRLVNRTFTLSCLRKCERVASCHWRQLKRCCKWRMLGRFQLQTKKSTSAPWSVSSVVMVLHGHLGIYLRYILNIKVIIISCVACTVRFELNFAVSSNSILPESHTYLTTHRHIIQSKPSTNKYNCSTWPTQTDLHGPESKGVLSPN